MKVPEKLDPAAASSITCAGVTTYKAVKVSNVKPGQWLGVFGIGGLGNLALQYAKNVMGAKIVAFDINDDKLAFAKELGADAIINSKDVDPVAEVMKLTDNKGLDATVVTSVAKTPFNQAVDVVKAGARVVAVGLPVDKMNLDIPRLVLDGIEVVGSLVGTRQDLREAFEFAAENKVTPVIEFKSVDVEKVKEIVDKIKKYGLEDNTIIISTSYEWIKYIREYSDKIHFQYLGDITIENINLLKKYGNYGIDIKIDKITKDKVDLAHLNAAKVNVWTVNNKRDINRLIDMGVDMITSDLGF